MSAQLKTRRRKIGMLICIAMALSMAQAQTATGTSSAPGSEAVINPSSSPLPYYSQNIEVEFEVPINASQVMVSLPIEHITPGKVSISMNQADTLIQTLPAPIKVSGRNTWWLELPRVTGQSTEHRTRHIRMNFTVPGSTLSTLSQAWISIQYQDGRTAVISGTNNYRNKPENQEIVTRNGIISSPQDGLEVHGRSSTNVTIVTPYHSEVTLAVNGVIIEDTKIGKQTDDKDRNITTREYIAVPLTVGKNVITAESENTRDQVSVIMADVAARGRISNVKAVANGVSNIEVEAEILDLHGIRTVIPTITIEDTSNLKLITPDQDPSQAGHQIRVDDGIARFTLAPTNTPGSEVMTLLVNGHTVRLPLELQPDLHRTVVAIASGTAQLINGIPEANGEIRMSIEAPLGRGQLTAAVDSAGTHDRELVEVRVPTLGDSSTTTRSLSANGPVAARYDHPAFNATYARNAARDNVFSRPDDGDTLMVATTPRNNWRVESYIAPWAGASREIELSLNGTRVTRLKDDIDPRTVRLYLEIEQADVITRKELIRGRDFVIDEVGVITLPRPIDTQPDLDTTVKLIARGVVKQDRLAPSAQTTVVRQWRSGETEQILSAGVRWRDSQSTTYGVRYIGRDSSGDNTFSVDASAFMADGKSRAQVLANITRTIGSFPESGTKRQNAWQISAEHESQGYDGVAATGVSGQRATLDTTTPINDHFSVHSNIRMINSSANGLSIRTTGDLQYKLNKQTTLEAGTFIGTNEFRGFGISGSMRYENDPWIANLGSQYNITTGETNVETSVLRKFKLNRVAPPGTELAFGVKAQARRNIKGEWNFISGLAATGRSGPYMAEIEYAMPNTSGPDGMLRGSITADFPITPEINLAARASASTKQQQASAELRVKKERVSATIGADIGHNNQGFSRAAKFSVNYITSPAPLPAAITADGLYVRSPEGSGYRLTLGGSGRRENWSTAGYLRVRGGSLAASGKDELTGELESTYNGYRHNERLGLAAQIQPGDPQGLALQAVVGAKYWITDQFAAGATYRGFWQPYQQRSAQSFGVEASWRPVPEFTTTLGYNFMGYSPITAEPTQRGFYVRLDTVIQSGYK